MKTVNLPLRSMVIELPPDARHDIRHAASRATVHPTFRCTCSCHVASPCLVPPPKVPFIPVLSTESSHILLPGKTFTPVLDLYGARDTGQAARLARKYRIIFVAPSNKIEHNCSYPCHRTGEPALRRDAHLS